MPLENKNLATLPSPINESKERKILVTIIAENIDTNTPIPSVNANPLINDVPNQNKIRAVIILEIFESLIDAQAREKPSLTASAIVRPERNSSLMRSKISTLASTAIPMEITNPAIPAAVNVTGINLKSAKIIAIKIHKDTVAMIPGKRYQRIKKRVTRKNPII